jgi:diguanylate cyclase (GGDEF)-like protein
MSDAPLPGNEAERLAALSAYAVLDTACEVAFDNIVGLAALVAESPISLVSFVDADRQWFKARVGIDERQGPRQSAFCAHAILTPFEPLIIPDARADPRFAANPLVTGKAAFRFYAGFPLVDPQGYALGTLCVIDRKPHALSELQYKMLAALADMAMTTLELHRATGQVQQAALRDGLTGLPNRTALFTAITESIEAQRVRHAPFSLAFLDLDGFKGINDQHGHAIGDAVLVEIAGALRRLLHEGGFVARLSGDEFAVLLTGDHHRAAFTMEALRQEVAHRMVARGWAVTASIGLAHFANAPGGGEAALAIADRLMYSAKAAGKNRVVVEICEAPMAWPLGATSVSRLALS